MGKIIRHMILLALLLLPATGINVNAHSCQDHPHHCTDECMAVGFTDDFIAPVAFLDVEDSLEYDFYYSTHLLIENPGRTRPAFTVVFNYKEPPSREVVLSRLQVFLI